MPHARPAPRQEAIVALLREQGKMTLLDIADALEMPLKLVKDSIVNARRHRPGQVFRVVGYRPLIGRRGQDLQLYMAEAGPDKPRPKTDVVQRRRDAQRRYHERRAAELNAKTVARRAELAGRPLAVNMWNGLAAPELRSSMNRLAANTSMREAA